MVDTTKHTSRAVSRIILYFQCDKVNYNNLKILLSPSVIILYLIYCQEALPVETDSDMNGI